MREVSVGTGAVILDADRVLLVLDKRSKRGAAGGKWGIVGGILEADLTFEENVRKESREEAGIEVRIVGLVGVYQHVDHQYNRISVIYLAEPRGTTRQGWDSEEIGGVRWFSVDDVPWEDLRFPHNVEMIRDALALSQAAAAVRGEAVVSHSSPLAPPSGSAQKS